MAWSHVGRSAGVLTALVPATSLGPIAVIFAMLAAVLGNVIYPRFARIQEPGLLWRRYWQILGSHAALALALLAITAMFPHALLRALGPKYAHLEKELFLMMLSAVILSILGCILEFGRARKSRIGMLDDLGNRFGRNAAHFPNPFQTNTP
jgi:hypothetical protein